MIVLGRIVAPYGVKGWVKVYSFGDDPAAWLGVQTWWLGASPDGDRWSPTTLEELRVHGKGLIAKFAGADDRTAAEGLDGLYLAVAREGLPPTAEGEFYWDDLIGLKVVNEVGESLGSVDSLIETGAHDVLVVRDGEVERLLPFVAQVVKEVNKAAGRIVVAWQKDW